MKKYLIYLLLLLLPFLSKGQTAITLVQKDTTGVDMFRPGVGLNDYQGLTPVINWPDPAINARGPDLYIRIQWGAIQTGPSSFNWSDFDSKYNNAIDRGQKVIIGFPSVDDGFTAGTDGGVKYAYPTFVHTGMQAQAIKDWKFSTTQWVPNWNSTVYLNAWDAWMLAVRAHLNTLHAGKSYLSYLYAVDIRGFGNYGEWHLFGAGHGTTPPAGTEAHDTSLMRIVNAHKIAFPDWPLLGNINMLNGANSSSDVSTAFGAWFLAQSNNWGHYGLRWDHACDLNTFNYDWTNNVTTGGGFNFKTEISNRHLAAPFVGEPQQFNFAAAGQCNYYHTMVEAVTYGATMIENANNIMNGGAIPTCTADLFRSIAKRMGYRYTMTSARTSDSVTNNGPFNFNIAWANKGICATYEKWNVTFEFRQAGVVKFSFISSFKPFLFMNTATVNENFTLPAGLSGTYDLYMIIRETGGVRTPLPLQLTTPARQVDGAYPLKLGLHIAVAGTTPPPPPPPPPNNPPSVFAGANQTDTLPKNIDTLPGTATDIDGDILTLSWIKVSGPAVTITSPTSATTTITGLVAGNYVFRLTANDGKGGITSDDVNVVVTAANIPPTTKAGNDIFISTPTTTATLLGVVTDGNGDAFTVLWAQLSGPNTATMGASTNVTNGLTGLIVGTYVFKLTATDVRGGIGRDTVSVFLSLSVPPNIPPIVSAGVDIYDTLPTSSVTLIGTASDANADPLTYLWQRVSGPNTPTMGASTSLTNGLSGLIEGQYVYRLTANDGNGGITFDEVNIFVAPAPAPPPPPPNLPPAVSAGPVDSTITLPADSAFLYGFVIDTATTPWKDTTIASYQWFKFSGPTPLSVATPTTINTKVSGLVQGDYRFRLRVTDKAGNIVDVFTLIHVLPAIPVDPDPPPPIPDKQRSPAKRAF